ncbi:pitrilysin family protein [Myxosarcina sp. GI1]|uniref:M16 family metallopeptidase n=1 Tax=Myxosarcina sp. GI1 TaxID=1541065 RepID=UPI00055F15FE|nr:pitrilysin family protein [Myxosarcina sp. GI1]
MPRLLESLNTVRFLAETHKLDNGLTLIHQYLPATPVVVADVWVKAGTTAEPEAWSGMAHFLEHAIFKGSPNLKAGEFDWIIENVGGMANAATSYDYAHFYLTTATAHIEQTLPCLADILLHASIPDEEFDRERDVVLEEIHSSYDDPDWIAFQTLCQTLYQHHPYKRSILGEKELLMQHTPDRLRCFHRAYYQPENMTVVMIGGIESQTARSLVESSFTEFSQPRECPLEVVREEPSATAIRRQELRLPIIECARLLMGWVGPNASDLEEAIALDLLSVILAGGRCSRLVREFREERQLVLDICSDFSLQKDSSIFTINAWLPEEHLNEVESLLGTSLWQLQNFLVSELELTRAKRQLINNYIFSMETPSQLAGIYGFYDIVSSAEDSALYPQIVERLSAVQLRAVARRYLSPERYAITSLRSC